MKNQSSKKTFQFLNFFVLVLIPLLMMTCDFLDNQTCVDKDGDGYGKYCDPGNDCDDRDDSVYDGAPELCDGKDNNCNGETDEGCGCIDGTTQPCGSNIGECEEGVQTCVNGEWGPCEGEIGPAEEVCDGKDNDCNGIVDQENAAGCTDYYYDGDGDGYGIDDLVSCLCEPSGHYSSAAGGDCDDEDTTIHPGGDELCDGKDNDCDGDIDAGCECINGEVEECGTDEGECVKGIRTCIDGHWGQCEGCSGPQRERCNGKDDDCDGAIDEDAEDCTLYYYDYDGDNYGVEDLVKCLCSPDGYYTAPEGGDCDDEDPSIYPGAIETCDSVDNDCDGVIDGEGTQGCSMFYMDADGDGYGVSGQMKCLCKPVDRYRALTGGDCNDTDATIHPGATEICDNEDNNCDGQVDEHVKIRFYFDADRDGYGTSGYQELCSPSGNYSAQNNGDCNDNDPTIYPGAPEVCGDNKDNNCNQLVDETCISGSRIFTPGNEEVTFSIESDIIVTYSKVTVIGGGGGGDSGYYCSDSSGEVETFGGGGGAGEVVVSENVLDSGITYYIYVGIGGSGGPANTTPCSGTGDTGRDGRITRFVNWGLKNLFILFEVKAEGGKGARDTIGGEGYPGGTDGGCCVHCPGKGGNNGTGYGRGGDGTAFTSPGGNGQNGVIIIEWRGYYQQTE